MREDTAKEIFATVISADVELQYVSSYRTILSKIEKFKLYTLPFIEPRFEQVKLALTYGLPYWAPASQYSRRPS